MQNTCVQAPAEVLSCHPQPAKGLKWRQSEETKCKVMHHTTCHICPNPPPTCTSSSCDVFSSHSTTLRYCTAAICLTCQQFTCDNPRECPAAAMPFCRLLCRFTTQHKLPHLPHSRPTCMPDFCGPLSANWRAAFSALMHFHPITCAASFQHAIHLIRF
jgi:hypothetical protein